MRDFLIALSFDIMLLAATVFGAITQRGTILGWLCVGIVFWQTFTLVKIIRSI
jgi:hypothetical protein